MATRKPPKGKPPIDRENAQEAELLPSSPPDIPSEEMDFPTIPEVNFLLTPKAGYSVKDAIEINLACVLRMIGGSIGDKGALANIQLPEAFVEKLSDSAARHFTEMKPDAVG